MKLRTILIGAGALALALSGTMVSAGAANAATTATFAITAGSLSISEPASTVSLGSVTAGSLTLTGSLGDVTVTDARAALAAAWTASVSSTEFSAGTNVSQKVATTNISYVSGAGTAAAGQIGTFTPGTVASMDLVTRTAGVWAGTGSNTVTWNPSLTFSLLASQVAGTYTGTVTHSVA